MPVRNAEKFLAEAIESILSQSMDDFEFLILDDGSTDGSREIIEGFAARDARIRFFFREPRGLIETLNAGLAEARADLIARMDADDIASKDRFERQVGYLEGNVKVSVLGTQIRRIDGEGRPLRTKLLPTTSDALRETFRVGGNGICHPTVMCRKQDLLRAGRYREPFRHAEDGDLWLRVLEFGDLANLEEVLLSYRRHDENVTISHRSDQFFNHRFAKICAEIRAEGGRDPAELMQAGFNLDLIEDARSRQRVETLCAFHEAITQMEVHGRIVGDFNGDQLLAIIQMMTTGSWLTVRNTSKLSHAILSYAIERSMLHVAGEAFALSSQLSVSRHLKYIVLNPWKAFRGASAPRS